jgi:hypothetical protein
MLCSFFRQAALACLARPRFHDRPSVLLRHGAVLVVARGARLLAFADGVIYIEDGLPTRQEWAGADRYRRCRT